MYGAAQRLMKEQDYEDAAKLFDEVVRQHPYSSWARHAQIINQGGQLLLEDLGSGNGTFVRGQRLAKGQRVPVANGEKVMLANPPSAAVFALVVSDSTPAPAVKSR